MTRTLHDYRTTARPRRTAIAETARLAAAPEAPVQVTADGPTGYASIELTFELGRRALSAVDATIADRGSNAPELRFEIRRGTRAWSLAAVVIDDERDIRRVLAVHHDVTWKADPASRLWHLDTTLLRATFELDEHTPRALYAATPLVDSLGLKGGRYELKELQTG